MEEQVYKIKYQVWDKIMQGKNLPTFLYFKQVKVGKKNEKNDRFCEKIHMFL